jgi:hypothetical protein
MINEDYIASAFQKGSQGTEEAKPEGAVDNTTPGTPTGEDTTNATPAGGEQPAAPVAEVNSEASTEVADIQKSWEETLIEKSEGKFKTWDDLNSAITNNKPTELDGDLSKVQEFINNGGTFDSFLLSQATDYTKLSDLEIVKEKMIRDNPSMDASDVDFLMKQKYKLDEDEFGENEIRFSKIELKREAAKAKEGLLKLQSDLRISKPSTDFNNETEALAKKADYEKQRVQWLKNVDTTINEFKELSFKVGDQEFKHVVTDDQRNSVKEYNNDLNSFFTKYQQTDGSINMEQLHRDRYIIEYFPEIIRNAVSQAKAIGTEEIVNSIKNPGLKTSTQPSGSGRQTIQQQVKANMYRDLL